MSTAIHNGFLLSRHWRDTAAGVELEFWFATDSGPLRLRYSGQKALFFLAAAQGEQAQQLLGAETGWELRPLELQTFEQQPVLGLYFNGQRQARRCSELLRAQDLQPLEADINPADRFLMERFIAGGAQIQGAAQNRGGIQSLTDARLKSSDYRPPLKVVSLDIETAMSGMQLFSIAVHGTHFQGSGSFSAGSQGTALSGSVGDRAGDKAGQPLRKVFMLGSGASQDFVSSFSRQEDLLQGFLAWLADYDPDVLIGWNVVNFDLRYLQRLADQLGIALTLGRAATKAQWRELDDEGERYRLQLPGRVVLDGIDLLRAAFYQFESFALDNVAKTLLGEGKLLQGAGRGEEIAELFQRDKSQLANYNLRDCELVSEIFQHTGLLEFALARTAMTGLNLDRMGGSVASFDNLYLPRLHRRGYVAPNASIDLQASPGGFVLESTPGIFDRVLLLDFKSLYPSIIRTFCIDPLGLALGVAQVGANDEAARLPPDEIVPGFLSARFSKDQPILPELIRQLWQLRDRAKAEGDQALSQAIKIIMNSFYGVLGSPGCRFFDPRLASSITLRGHEILQTTRDYIAAQGHRVIYGDTDSVFVWLRDVDSDEAARALGYQLQASLNDFWRQHVRREYAVECALELEFETYYRHFLLPTVRGSEKGSKKRYAGVVVNQGKEELVFKGLEAARSDWTRLARDFQRELYRLVFAKQDYRDFILAELAALRGGQRDEKLLYRKRLRRRLADYVRNVPPHVQAARLCATRGVAPPSRGDWVEYVISSAGAEPAAAVLAPLDYQHYVDKQLAPVADGVLNLLGDSFAALVDRQITLF